MDYINIAKEQVKGAAGKNYIPTMHPASFSSSKTKRGPLKGAWVRPRAVLTACAVCGNDVCVRCVRWCGRASGKVKADDVCVQAGERQLQLPAVDLPRSRGAIHPPGTANRNGSAVPQ